MEPGTAVVLLLLVVRTPNGIRTRATAVRVRLTVDRALSVVVGSSPISSTKALISSVSTHSRLERSASCIISTLSLAFQLQRRRVDPRRIERDTPHGIEPLRF